MQKEWKYVGNAAEGSATIAFRMTLAGEVARERDHRLMEYYRGIQEKCQGRPLSVDMQGLTDLWDQAWIAGRDSAAPDPIGGLANSGVAEKAKSKKRRSKKSPS